MQKSIQSRLLHSVSPACRPSNLTPLQPSSKHALAPVVEESGWSPEMDDSLVELVDNGIDNIQNGTNKYSFPNRVTSQWDGLLNRIA